MRGKLILRKIALTAISINLLQIIIILGIIILNFINRKKVDVFWSPGLDDFLLLFIIITVVISSFYTIRNQHAISFISKEQGMLKSTVGELEALNRTLRAQRHDFINHLQVVYSLMEMSEYEEAKDYIEKVYNDIQKINQVLKTSNPAVNALLQAKAIYCEKSNIRMDINITSSLESLPIPSWELCRILGNIIDNAIHALENKPNDKTIRIEIYENLKSYGFSIGNNGNEISKEIIHMIFDAGFTTKGENGQGMGLFITKEIISSYGGEISVKSYEKYTVFEGTIPKRLDG